MFEGKSAQLSPLALLHARGKWELYKHISSTFKSCGFVTLQVCTDIGAALEGVPAAGCQALPATRHMWGVFDIGGLGILGLHGQAAGAPASTPHCTVGQGFRLGGELRGDRFQQLPL